MTHRPGLAVALIVTLSTGLYAEEFVAPGAAVEKLAGDMKFTEGPVWLPQEGVLVFSDIPASEMKRWSPTGGVTTFRAPSAEANGNTLDREGRLITCEHKGRRVARQERDGTVVTLAERHDGKRFNSPNDVVVKSDGSIWFTDPGYGLPRDGKAREMDGNYVYRLDPATGGVTRVADGFEKPNGLCFSPDEKTLYVSDTGAGKHIRAFDVGADGTLSGSRVLCVVTNGVPDGIRCDEAGRIWSSAGDGIWIFAPSGERVGFIAVPESPANLCFGGPDGRTLFITARKSLYSVRVTTRGAGR